MNSHKIKTLATALSYEIPHPNPFSRKESKESIIAQSLAVKHEETSGSAGHLARGVSFGEFFQHRRRTRDRGHLTAGSITFLAAL